MSRFSRWRAFVSIAILGLSQFLLGQSVPASGGPPTAGPGTMSNHHQILITGCLKRGSEAGTYQLTDENGRTWKLVSGNVDLAGQVFRVVKIAGKEVATSPPSSPENPDDAAKAGGNPSFTLRAMSVEVVSRSCTR